MLDPLPTPLIDAVREGRGVLFLAAGASYGAHHPQGNKVPDGNRLRDLICDRFLNGELKSSTLIECADYAIDSHDLNTFQQFIRDTFVDFLPAPFHYLIPSFNWNSIFTTNYDLLVEKAYQNHQGGPSLVGYIKDGQKIDLELKNKSNSVLLTKLHGCINHYLDTEIPLVLSSDQYVNVSKNRRMLFDRLLNHAAQFPVIFVGYRAADIHIKRIFSDLEELGQRRPRYFYISPNIGSYQRSYLETRRTTCIAATFESFLTGLDRQLSSPLRTVKLDIDAALSPIRKHINVPNPRPSGDLVAFLTSDVECVYSTMPFAAGKDADFYEGRPLGFHPIATDLDVRRNKKTDTFLSDIFFRMEEDDDNARTELCVVKGAAGAGKSVFIRRLAWEAAINFNCLCLYHRRAGSLRYAPLEELYALTSSRIFLFVDRAAYHVDEIDALLSRARSGKIPLTLVTAERHNEWNVRCERLEKHVAYEDEVTRLSSQEVERLVSKLRKANALGVLSDKSDKECKEIFETKLDRQILVALHEATKGKTFEDIVIDEYRRIIPIEAQLLYLDICTFQRFGAELRAGLISRIGGVSFREFEERLLRPLEKVVFVTHDRYSKDYLYISRHQRIAEIVFEHAIESQKEKYDIIVRLLKGINRDYSSDNEAFEALMHGATLRSIFANADLARQLLDEGLAITGNDEFILHQRAVFELQHADGDPTAALEFINRALSKNPTDKAKLNTKANVYRRLAQQTTNEIKRARLRGNAFNVLNSIQGKGGRDYTLLLNVQIDELLDLLKANSQGELSERAIAGKCQEIDRLLIRAHSASPADPFVLQAEARYRQEIKQSARAFAAIKRAHELNPSIVPIALRLARVYLERDEIEQAVVTLTGALTRTSSKELRFELGKLLSERPELQPGADAVDLLEKSFDLDDGAILPRLYLLREYWRRGKAEKYRQLQRSLMKMQAPRNLRSDPRFIIEQNGKQVKFRGVIRRKEADYAFIDPDEGYPDVFLHRLNASDVAFDQLTEGAPIIFAVGFCTKGATAVA
jgi:cold shock CspA family protein